MAQFAIFLLEWFVDGVIGKVMGEIGDEGGGVGGEGLGGGLAGRRVSLTESENLSGRRRWKQQNDGQDEEDADGGDGNPNASLAPDGCELIHIPGEQLPGLIPGHFAGGDLAEGTWSPVLGRDCVCLHGCVDAWMTLTAAGQIGPEQCRHRAITGGGKTCFISRES